MVRLWAGGGRDAPRVVFDGQPKYRAEAEGEVLRSRLQSVRWEVVRVDELRAELRLGKVVLGPLSGELVYTFFEGLPMFVEELRLRAEAPVRLKTIERFWFGFRTGPGLNVFQRLYWEGGEYGFSRGGKGKKVDSSFLYLWNGKLGLGMFVPLRFRGEIAFLLEDREDWTANVGVALQRPVELGEGARWSFPVAYYLGCASPKDFGGWVGTLGIKGYRKLPGRKVLAFPDGGRVRPGVEVVLGDEGWEGVWSVPVGEIRAGSGCRRKGGKLPGRGFYVLPCGEVRGEGCLDAIADQVEEAGGVTARLENSDIPIRTLLNSWSRKVGLFGFGGSEEELRRYDALLNRRFRPYLFGVREWVQYIELEEMELAELLSSLREGRYFPTTGEIVATTYKLVDGEVLLGLEWTFPLREVVVRSEEGVLLREVPPPDLSGKKGFAFEVGGREWVRVEAWDVLGGGCVLQPLWRTG